MLLRNGRGVVRNWRKAVTLDVDGCSSWHVVRQPIGVCRDFMCAFCFLQRKSGIGKCEICIMIKYTSCTLIINHIARN